MNDTNQATKEIDYTNYAKKVVETLSKDNRDKILLTTSQIRKLMSAVSIISNKIDIKISKGELGDNLIDTEIYNLLLDLKIKIVYQIGREKQQIKGSEKPRPIAEFEEKANLIKYIDTILSTKSLNKLNTFIKYFEALVAYHKYMGGKE